MKAILNINKKSQYAKYNGLTFKVVELLRTMVALDIEGRTTDFSFNEVIIVDIAEELETTYRAVGKKSDLFIKLRDYAINNSINTEYTSIIYKA